MKLPVIDDQGKLRWAIIGDEYMGVLDRPLSLQTLIQARIAIISQIASATHGIKAASHLSKIYRLTPKVLGRLFEGRGTANEIRALELAFQNAIQRVRLAAKP